MDVSDNDDIVGAQMRRLVVTFSDSLNEDDGGAFLDDVDYHDNDNVHDWQDNGF